MTRQAQVLPVDPVRPERAPIARAAEVLRAGGLVAFPTETVYGLGADAVDAAAVERLFAAKGRPADNPLIVHLHGAEALSTVVAGVTPLAERLAAAFWPGPLTLVLDAAPQLPRSVRAGLDTVGVRVPGHPVALALLRAAGRPVAAPSANRSGRPSPTAAEHVVADLAEHVDVVLDAGPCRFGVESTVVDARGEQPVVLRDGAVSREALQAPAGVAGRSALAASPGTRHRHYQPGCRVVLAAPGEAPGRAAELADARRAVGLVSREPAPEGVAEVARFVDAEGLAGILFAALRRAEDMGLDAVVVETVPEHGVGRAVMDRLRRASAR